MSRSKNKVSHPIPYQGSKRALATDIIAYFPTNTDRLIEPFAGSAAISLAAAYHGKARRFFIADINEALVDLWKEIIYRPETLADAYGRLWVAQLGRERRFYNAVRTRFNQTHRPDYFLYLLARCVKASVRYNPSGEFNQSPDNRRKGAKPATMRARIVGASRLLKGRTELMYADYKETLKLAESQDIVYMDPPYKGVCTGGDKRYAGTVSFDGDAFVDSLRGLTDRGMPFIVSYDGQTGEKTFGEALPEHLGLTHLEINAGKSSQATLLGRDVDTIESLYLSPNLVESPYQYSLFTVG